MLSTLGHSQTTPRLANCSTEVRSLALFYDAAHRDFLDNPSLYIHYLGISVPISNRSRNTLTTIGRYIAASICVCADEIARRAL